MIVEELSQLDNFRLTIESVMTILIMIVSYFFCKTSGKQSDKAAMAFTSFAFAFMFVQSALVLDYASMGGVVNLAVYFLGFALVDLVLLYELRTYHLRNNLNIGVLAFSVSFALLIYMISQVVAFFDLAIMKTTYFKNAFGLIIPTLDAGVFVLFLAVLLKTIMVDLGFKIPTSQK